LIIFTDNNELAYKIGRDFCLPVITHKTKLKERKTFLEYFRSNVLRVLVTSKVLNEGVDVPSASVGVVISGSGAVREHVQRLGRILRNAPGKRAVLYELVAKSTSEKYVNERRKQHHAYQKPSTI
jgi:superfamily II DNA or RNA helicase